LHPKIERFLVAEKNKGSKCVFAHGGGPPPPSPKAYRFEISTLEPAFSAAARYTRTTPEIFPELSFLGGWPLYDK
jgi:hypothetical protein